MNDIINTDIIRDTNDAFWEELPAPIQALTPRPAIVISSPYAEGSNEATQLQKILQACTLSTEQYNIIQLTDNQSISFHKLKQFLDCKFIILFGVMPHQLGVSVLLRLNEPNRFAESIWVPSLALAALEANTEMKKQLWLQGLKPVFVDKSFGNI